MKRLSCICIAVVMLFVGVAIGFAVNKQSDATSVRLLSARKRFFC